MCFHKEPGVLLAAPEEEFELFAVAIEIMYDYLFILHRLPHIVLTKPIYTIIMLLSIYLTV